MFGERDVSEYYKEQSKKGVKFAEASMKLKRIDYVMAAYGDWYLYEDEDGNRWQDYFSIGD